MFFTLPQVLQAHRPYSGHMLQQESYVLAQKETLAMQLQVQWLLP
jgi:hypothetical protein